MRKHISYLFFLILLSTLIVNAQMSFTDSFEDYHILPLDSLNPMRSNSTVSYLNSTYGKSFTPKGDFKILIICAGLGEPFDSYPMDGWM